MGDINEVISVDAASGIAGLKAFTDALEQASAKYAALEDKLKGGLGGAAGAAGADKIAASVDKAAASIDAAVSRINAALDKIGGGADAAAAGIGRLNAAADAAAGGLRDASGSADVFAASTDRAAASADASAAALERQAAAAKRVRAATAEQDAAVAASARSRSSAVTQAVADEEAAQKRYRNLLLGGAAVAGYGVYKAMQLQAGATRLVTTAGESPQNLAMIQAGILRMAGQTATSQQELMAGAYMVESAGFHGRNALPVLKAAAEGAYAEGAPLGETGNALTSLLNAYGLRKGVPVQQQATSAMNQIIAMVSQGKMTMSGAVTALPAVLPVAAASGLKFPQVGGALATMTSMGMSPDQAAQNLAHTIGALANPSHVQTLEMQQLGLNSVQLSKNLGKEGLTGAIGQVETAILHNMGPAGTVLLKSFNASKLAASSARQEIAAMPPSLRGTAQAFLDGSLTTRQWMSDLKGLPPLQSNLLKQFQGTADAAHGFNNELKAGGGNAQTFQAALAKAMGGQVGRNVALMLGGAHMAGFQARTAAVAAAGAQGGQDVAGWPDVQKTLKYRLGAFDQQLQGVATQLGQTLLPGVTSAMQLLSKPLGFLGDHPGLAKDLVLGAGGIGLLGMLPKLARPLVTGAQMAGKVAEVLHIPGLDKLAGIGQGSGLNGAAASLKGAAADLSAAAGKLAEEGGLGGVAGKGATAAEREAASAAETGGVLGWLKGAKASAAAAAPYAGQGIVIGAIVKAIGDSIAPKGTFAGNLSKQFQATPSINAGPLHPSVFGGFEGWLTSHVGLSVGHAINSFIGGSGGGVPSARSLAIGGYASAAASQQTARLSAQIPRIDTSQIGLTGLREGGKLPKLPAPQVAKPKVPAPDLGAFNAAMASAMHKPVKLAPPDLSALTGAKSKAQGDAKAITTAMETSLHKPVKATRPDLSAYTAAAGAARSDGAAISAGLAGGILAGEGAVVAAASQVASAAAAAMRVAVNARSPSRVTYKTGQDTAAGFEHGIKSKTHAVKAASAALSASAVTSLTQGLQGGKDAIDAAMQALTGKGARPQDITNIISTISTLKGDVSRAVSKGVIGQVEGSRLSVMLELDNHRLQGLARQRSRLEQEITDAEQIAQQVISGASVTGAQAYTPALAASSGPLSAYATVSGMQAQAADQTTFAQRVRQLRKMGLNPTSLDQLIQGGAQQGLPIAEGLTQGGAGQIKQLNAAEKQIHDAASSIGNTGGQAMYEAGQQAGQGIAAGLKSQLSAVDAAMKDIARHMMATLEHALAGHAARPGHGKAAAHAAVNAAAGAAASSASGAAGTPVLHVPSLGHLARMADSAAAALGRDAAAGGRAASALDRLASAASRVPAAGHHGHPGGHGGGTAPAVVVNVNVTVHVEGNVHTENDLVNALQERVLERSANNWRTGLVYPGRAV